MHGLKNKFCRDEKIFRLFGKLTENCGTVNESTLLKWSLTFMYVWKTSRGLFEEKIHRWQFIRNNNLNIFAVRFQWIYCDLIDLIYSNMENARYVMIVSADDNTFFWTVLREKNCSLLFVVKKKKCYNIMNSNLHDQVFIWA